MKIKHLLLITLAIGLTHLGIAQVTTSGLNGKVSDTKGESLPGATVVAVHTPSGTQYGSLTDAVGNYRMANMRVGGPYTLTITFVGYKPFTLDNLYLSLGQTATINADLIEAVAQISGVEVIAQRNALIDGNRTGASTNVNAQQIARMPSISRSINDFTRLSPQSNGNSFAGRDGRYNNISIDGANFNNNFGLSSKSLPGGDAQPISLDAIEEINVNIAPFDIRQSNFTGANITAVTRSGDNTWKGSVYGYYRDNTFNGTKVADKTLTLSDQTTSSYGLRVGGPLVKDKLFIFLNAEKEKSSFPGIPWKPSTDGKDSAEIFVSRTTESDLATMKDYLMTQYNYDAGTYKDFDNFLSENYKILAKLDWNINKHHRFTTRFNYVKSTNDQQVNATSSPGTRSAFGRIGEMSMAFSNANYGFLNTVGSLTAELNSLWNRYANKFLVTYTKIQDTRSSNSSEFPFVDIYKDGNPYMSFGYELFTKDNDVINNVLTFTDNINFYYGNHTFTAGASFDKMYFGNSYKRYGTSYYRYASMDDFMTGKAPTTFGITYPYGSGDGYAKLNFGYGSAYLQDEYAVNKQLKLTGGLRLEQAFYMDELQGNPAIEKLRFNNLNGDSLHIDVGSWPKTKMTVSPRFGFNLDVYGDQKLQFRGGTGVFTGRLPFVWFTNQPTNSGVLQNTVELTKAADLAGLVFNPDPFYNVIHDTTLFSPRPSSKAPGSIAVVDKNFKMPQVWRTSLAFDHKLPWWNLVLTAEAIFTKEINAVFQYNANLKATDTAFLGADYRERYLTNKINSGVSSAMVLSNTKNGGYSYSLTVSLTKPFTTGLSGFVAYTYSGARDLTSNPGSAAQSAWASNPSVRNQNYTGLSYSQFAVPHRVVGAITYSIEYLKNLATTVSLYYSGSSQGRLDYIYSNDMNGDGNAADLMYIPRDNSEIAFSDIKDNSGAVVFTADQQREAFWKFVDQDKYLSNHKGGYCERYGIVMPWLNRWDVKVMQDIFTNLGKHRHSLQISLDILNVGNLIKPEWGVAQKQAYGSYDITLLKYVKTGTDGIPVYQMATGTSAMPTTTYVNVLSTTSTWGAQFGLRYTF